MRLGEMSSILGKAPMNLDFAWLIDMALSVFL